MKEYETVIDLGSKTFRVEAESKKEAEEKAVKEFEKLSDSDRLDEYWAGDCSEVKNEKNKIRQTWTRCWRYYFRIQNSISRKKEKNTKDKKEPAQKKEIKNDPRFKELFEEESLNYLKQNDKKYQLLLHIGLPKTATTSLQHNVLYPLHKEGKINFLGAVLSNSLSLKFYPLCKV